MFLFFALLCLFCNVISFCSNPFETKSAEKKRKEKYKHFSFLKRVLLLPGYPLWRRIGCYWCLAVVVLDVVTQVCSWAFAYFSNTRFAESIAWLNMFTLFCTYAIYPIQTCLFFSSKAKSQCGKIGYLLMAAFALFAGCLAIVLMMFASTTIYLQD